LPFGGLYLSAVLFQGSTSPDAQVVDCADRTLMPGLVEAHAHLSWPSSVGRIFRTMTLPPEEHLLVAARNAKVTLDAGFTSAYSAGSLGGVGVISRVPAAA
jgi:imidazolonepropionase-like amidohydrolase